jgi:hypothetical protein
LFICLVMSVWDLVYFRSAEKLGMRKYEKIFKN